MNHFIADDGEFIHMHLSGDGPPLILLHGWTASHVEWSMFLRGLNPHFRVFRWDARGHGGHALRTPTKPDLVRLARDLHHMLDHYQLTKVAIVAHSMGALVLWQYIQDYGTHRLNKICIIDQSPKLVTDADWRLGIYGDFDEQRAMRFLADLRVDFAESVLQLIAFGRNARARTEYHANPPAWQKTRERFRQLSAEPLITIWQSMTNADYRSLQTRIDIPTLLIFGGESNFYPVETGHFLCRSIPGSVLHIYEGEDHSPHMYQRDRFLHELREFLG